ncbi:hypothetical protein CGRA01v4_07387 [Colletotrichum graminicola]|nr:hypothetical protein CGRA01v4_07387 [Colletotrichum graminicola]
MNEWQRRPNQLPACLWRGERQGKGRGCRSETGRGPPAICVQTVPPLRSSKETKSGFMRRSNKGGSAGPCQALAGGGRVVSNTRAPSFLVASTVHLMRPQSTPASSFILVLTYIYFLLDLFCEE